MPSTLAEFKQAAITNTLRNCQLFAMSFKLPRSSLTAWLAAGLLMNADCHLGPSKQDHIASCCATNRETPAEFTDKSLYQLDSTWTTDDGQQIKLGALQGRGQVVVMFFASCQAACPILVHDMKRIEASLSENTRAEVGFTLVTIDIERDTPEAPRQERDWQSRAPRS